jgi:hypothetical protein
MRFFYDNLLRIKTFKTLSGNVKNLVATATADASVQPLGKEGRSVDAGVYGATYIAYCDENTPVKKGDRVVDSNNVSYDVMEVHMRDYGALQHKELIIIRNKA